MYTEKLYCWPNLSRSVSAAWASNWNRLTFEVGKGRAHEDSSSEAVISVCWFPRHLVILEGRPPRFRGRERKEKDGRSWEENVIAVRRIQASGRICEKACWENIRKRIESSQKQFPCSHSMLSARSVSVNNTKTIIH